MKKVTFKDKADYHISTGFLSFDVKDGEAVLSDEDLDNLLRNSGIVVEKIENYTQPKPSVKEETNGK